jgi:dTDP-4-dehydrorhamnose reductase
MLGREQADLSQAESLRHAIEDFDGDAVINLAAWTGVDGAEADEPKATIVNGSAPGVMARSCAEKGLPFIHVSTDYVFDGGSPTPLTVEHPTAPLGAYGRSKLAGEIAVRNSGARHVILRTSWVFSSHGSNFVKTMLRLGQERKKVQVVSDQRGGPTPASALADALLVATETLIGGHKGGTFHFAGAPETSWADFARAIFRTARLQCEVEDISTAYWPSPTPRPLYSYLDCFTFEQAFGVQRPDWRESLPNVLADLGMKQ